MNSVNIYKESKSAPVEQLLGHSSACQSLYILHEKCEAHRPDQFDDFNDDPNNLRGRFDHVCSHVAQAYFKCIRTN